MRFKRDSPDGAVATVNDRSQTVQHNLIDALTYRDHCVDLRRRSARLLDAQCCGHHVVNCRKSIGIQRR